MRLPGIALRPLCLPCQMALGEHAPTDGRAAAKARGREDDPTLRLPRRRERRPRQERRAMQDLIWLAGLAGLVAATLAYVRLADRA